MPMGALHLPENRSDWERQRATVKETVLQCLGCLPKRPDPVAVRTIWKKSANGYTVEKFVFNNGIDSEVPGYLAIPDNRKHPVPAVIAMHGHGGCKEELFGMVSSHHDVAGLLASKGFATLAIDCYFSGERVGTGPNGLLNRSRRNTAEEMALFKLNLWLGRSLWGMMLRDQQIAIDYLQSRPEVDHNRIGAQGMSLGSTGAWWLAAIDDRIQAIVSVACFTRYEDLIATRALSGHGIYFFVPGILRHFDSEGVMALVAPRPFLALTGDSDAGSPPEGIRKLEAVLRHVYGLYGKSDNFESVVYPRTGHVYTEGMKKRMLAWLEKSL
jgi:dienelactone hydrolase